MAAHHVVELVVSGVVCGGKLILWGVGETLGEAIVEGVLELVKAPFRRRNKRVEPEREAKGRRSDDWAVAVAEARAQTPERPAPDPHILKLRRIPTPPRAGPARCRAGRGDGAFPPPGRSTGG